MDRIKSLYFEDGQHGWAGGDWGELLRYENGQWHAVHSPTRGHITNFFTDRQGHIFAATDNRFSFECLAYQNGQWQILRKFTLDFLNLKPLGQKSWVFQNDRREYYFNLDSLWALDWPSFDDFDYFPDGTGYAINRDGVFSLNDTTARKMGILEGLDARKLTLSPDGYGWIYGGGGGLWALGRQTQKPTKAKILISLNKAIDASRLLGGAYLVLQPNLQGFYLVRDSEPNLVMMRLWRKSRGKAENLSLRYSSDFGLQEPARNQRGEPNYTLGVLTADFNNDGREDVFLTSLYGKSSLFLNLGRGHFKDVAEWAGFHDTPTNRYSMAATADVDNDGDLDIFLPNEFGPSYLFLNNGVGRFSDHTAESGIRVPVGGKAAAFGDIDQDGWIDLAVTTFGEGNYLFRNLGHGKFQDITPANPALHTAEPEKCPSLTFADYDNDGDLDLFICKLLASNQLLENDGRGHFIDVTEKVGLVDSNLSRGAVFFDYDQDGDQDLFISNMGPDQFFTNIDGKRFEPLDIFAPPGNNFPWLASESPAFFYKGFSTGVIKFDYNRDGDLDLLVLSYDRRGYLIQNLVDNDHFLGFRL
ncbi:MAG: VCBS repeat-containing protein, partial [Calditrichaeota bacterium]